MAGWSAKWNVYSVEGFRTNNNLEWLDSKVKQIASKNHLNIFKIVELFEKEQYLTEVEIWQLI